jgi:phosphate uptake regulator/aminoglycoside phosphotransferase (APT) family kinase protein
VPNHTPLLDEDLKRNFRFLVLEVIKQIGSAARYLDGQTDVDIARLSSRDDYIDHLRTQIENKCFALLRQRKRIEKATVDFLRSTTTVTTNLERIADHAVSIVENAARLEPRTFLERYDFDAFFEVIFQALQEVVGAFEAVDTEGAVRIADGELVLDELYKDRFDRILEHLESGGDARRLVTSMLIFHYLERIGDCLLNIGEAIISAEMGERMKIRAYRELAGSLERRPGGPKMDEVSFQGVWGTRSGAQIGRVKASGIAASSGEAIFKRGDPKKLRKERSAMERWSHVAPGLAPKVLRYQEAERDSMLVEYLEGQTLLEIVLHARMSYVEEVLARVQQTLVRIWLDTKKDEPIEPRFLAQLRDRTKDVYAVHPYFRAEPKDIGGLHVATLEELIAASMHLDDELSAPFSVFGHGDFNLDNIIYNETADTVHFIDLHRSRRMDYTQDVSVFLVSNFRIPEFRPRRRAQINRVIELQLDFARRFAKDHGDATFEARLALGLVRSFVSSTRFDIRRTFAEEMLRRGLYLLELLGRCEDTTLQSFRLPKDVLIYTT